MRIILTTNTDNINIDPLKSIIITKQNIERVLTLLSVRNQFSHEIVIIENISMLGLKLNILMYFIKYYLIPEQIINTLAISGDDEILNMLHRYFMSTSHELKEFEISRESVMIESDNPIEFIQYNDYGSLMDNISGSIKKYYTEGSVLVYMSNKYVMRQLSKIMPNVHHISKIGNIATNTEPNIIVSIGERLRYEVSDIKLIIDTLKITNTLYSIRNKIQIDVVVPVSGSKVQNRSRMFTCGNYKRKYIYLSDTPINHIVSTVDDANKIKNLQNLSSALLFMFGSETINKSLTYDIFTDDKIDTVISWFDTFVMSAKHELMITHKLLSQKYFITDPNVLRLSKLYPIINDLRYIILLRDNMNDYGFIILIIAILNKHLINVIIPFSINIFDFAQEINSSINIDDPTKNSIMRDYKEILDIYIRSGLPLGDSYNKLSDIIKMFNTVFTVSSLFVKIPKQIVIDKPKHLTYLKYQYSQGKTSSYKIYRNLYLTIKRINKKKTLIISNM